MCPIHLEELTEGSRGVFTDDVSVQIRRKLDGHGAEVLNLSDASYVATEDETVLIATFLDVPAEGGLTVPETHEDLIEELDARCAIDVSADGSG